MEAKIPENIKERARIHLIKGQLIQRCSGFILIVFYLLLNMMELHLATPATDFKVTGVKWFNSYMEPCQSGANGILNMHWLKATGFDYFDGIDSTWTGTGVIRSKRGEGCLLPKADTWYWIAYVSTRISTTECILNATLREPDATYDGSCDRATAGTSNFQALISDDREVYTHAQTILYSLTHGVGQEYTMNYGDYDMGGKNWWWIIYGLRGPNQRTPYYLNHMYYNLDQVIFEPSYENKAGELYNRMTKHEHLGISVESNPHKLSQRGLLYGKPSIHTFADEFIINKISDFTYTTGSRLLTLDYKGTTHSSDVCA